MPTAMVPKAALPRIATKRGVTRMIGFRGASAIVVSVVFCCATARAVCETPKSVEVRPCREIPRSPPITRECVAAAIAEEAFLETTHRQIALYRIYSVSPSPSRWRLIVEEGDENHPPPEGAHWFIFVDRSTERIEVQAGR